MSLHDDAFEAQIRHAVRAEAERIDLPSTIWPRLEARLARARARSQYGAEFEPIARTDDPRALILALLMDQEMDHHTLAQHLAAQDRKAGPRPRRPGGCLPLLHQLERDGLLSARWLPTSRGARRMYRAERRGHKVRPWARGVRWLSPLSAWARPSSARAVPTAEEPRD